MYLNGVILVSPTGLGIERSGPVQQSLMIPYYAATAWYHKALPPDLQQKDLNDVLPEVEDFTINELIPSIAKGGFIPDDKTLADYNKTTQPLLHKVDVNRDSIHTLSTLRDTLLFKLMSGEVRVKL